MKKLTLISGYLAVLCFAFFTVHKAWHMPGADILVIAGTVLFSLVFAILYFLERNKLADSGFKKAFNIINLLTMFSFGIALLAKEFGCPVFPAQLCVAYSFLLLAIAMQLITAFKDKDAAKSLAGHGLAIVTLILLALMVYLQLTMTSKTVLRDLNQSIVTQNKEIKFFEGKTASMLENLDKTSTNPAVQEYMKKADEVKVQSDSLVKFIRSLSEKMMFMAAKKKIAYDSLEKFRQRDNRFIAEKFMTEQHNDSLYQVKLKAYKSFISANTNSRGKEVIDLFFSGQDSTASKKCCSKECSGKECCTQCYCKSMISVLLDLNSDILHVRMLEAETVNYLQTMQAKVPR